MMSPGAADGQDCHYDSAATSNANHGQVFNVEEVDDVYANFAEARGELNARRTVCGLTLCPVAASLKSL